MVLNMITLLIYMFYVSRECLAKHRHHHSFMNNLIGASHATSLCYNVLFIARRLTSYMGSFSIRVVPSYTLKFEKQTNAAVLYEIVLL